MKTILVGMSPVKGDPKEPLSGPSGRRLAAMAGVDLAAFLKHFERVDLKVAGKSDPVARAEELRAKWKGRSVMLLGRAVAAAFRLNPEGYEWFELQEMAPGFDVVVCPHPNATAHWWNEPENVLRAKECMRRLRIQFVAPTKRNGKEWFTVDEIAAALEAGRGIYTWAADILAETSGVSCCSNTIKAYIKRYPDQLDPVLARSKAAMAGGVIKGIMAKAEAGDMTALKEMAGYRYVQDPARELLGIDLRKNVSVEHSGGMNHRVEVSADVQHALADASPEELLALRQLYGRMIEGTAEVLAIEESKSTAMEE